MEGLLSSQVHVNLDGVVELAQSSSSGFVVADESSFFELVESSAQVKRDGWWGKRFKGEGKSY